MLLTVLPTDFSADHVHVMRLLGNLMSSNRPPVLADQFLDDMQGRL
jgi:hypothetical protein